MHGVRSSPIEEVRMPIIPAKLVRPDMLMEIASVARLA
jgi:hypothetical protein